MMCCSYNSKLKIYFHYSSETFDILVVEYIVVGCMPIVTDISGYKKIVLFSEFRYSKNDINKIQEIIGDILNKNLIIF
jgi:hypothetical protein